jgi:hypothetical protein
MTYTMSSQPSGVAVVARALVRWTFYAGALFGSFFLTLWLTEPQNPILNSRLDSRSGGDRLAAERATSYADLTNAARAAGLRLSPQVKGHVDTMTRVNEREVSIVGWLADTAGDGSASQLVIFVGGAFTAIAPTTGERPDVTRAIGLGFGTEKNVAFRVNFNCRPGQQPVIAGVGTARQYVPLNVAPCP